MKGADGERETEKLIFANEQRIREGVMVGTRRADDQRISSGKTSEKSDKIREPETKKIEENLFQTQHPTFHPHIVTQ